MAGGKRPGAGRPKGSTNQATKAKQEAILAAIGGKAETPLQYMLRVMNDDKAEMPRRDDMARAAAPYIHPKQATIEHTGNVTVTHEGALKALA